MRGGDMLKRILGFFFCLIAIHLQGAVFFTPEMISSHLKDYSEEEIALINKDHQVVHGVCFDGVALPSTKTPIYLATAGAPGSRKSTILEKFLQKNSKDNFVYVDPDPRTLRLMVNTYYKWLTPLRIAQENNYDVVIQKAYDKWRGGSNYIALTLLEEALEGGYHVAHGTTLTGNLIPLFLKKLKEHNRKIVLLLCSCPDQLRNEAVQYRNSQVRFYQSTPQDALSKGLFFPQRMGAYFDYADELYFYWSDSLFAEERLGGVWRAGQLHLVDGEAMKRFIDKYEADRLFLAEQNVLIPAFKTYLDQSDSLKGR
jgi:hypothetical protein